MGIPCELIPPKRVAQLHPFINIHDLVGALHVPEDAIISSADVTLALANAAAANGMGQLPRCPARASFLGVGTAW